MSSNALTQQAMLEGVLPIQLKPDSKIFSNTRWSLIFDLPVLNCPFFLERMLPFGYRNVRVFSPLLVSPQKIKSSGQMHMSEARPKHGLTVQDQKFIS
jgi:hypothetical protein